MLQFMGLQTVGHDLQTEQTAVTLVESVNYSAIISLLGLRGEVSCFSPRLLKVKVLVSQLCPTLCDPMDCVARQAPVLMEFSRQEYCSG